MTIAALWATLTTYQDLHRAEQEIPTLAMLAVSGEDLRASAAQLCAPAEGARGGGGGGSVRASGRRPSLTQLLPTFAVWPFRRTSCPLIRRSRLCQRREKPSSAASPRAMARWTMRILFPGRFVEYIADTAGGGAGMKHVIIGTAGHVDPRQRPCSRLKPVSTPTALSRRKSGALPIELGFAHIDLTPDHTQAGIIDVPGHEIHQVEQCWPVLAASIDAMLVVAADEGFMPQTRGHLDILTLLGIRDGVVVITKTDMVDEVGGNCPGGHRRPRQGTF